MDIGWFGVTWYCYRCGNRLLVSWSLDCGFSVVLCGCASLGLRWEGFGVVDLTA